MLEGKIALVTGAAGTLGVAITKALLEDGLRVIIADVNEARLAELSQTWGENVYPLTVDISDFSKVETAYADTAKDFGAVDVLVNNAGILSNNKVRNTSAKEWRMVMGANLDGAFYLSQLVVPTMLERGWGRIINTCSMASKTGGVTAGTAYSTSKGALTSLTFSLARELAPHGITVNGLAPAYVKTKMIEEGLTEAQRQELLKLIPVGRFCEPEEVAHVVRFLVSPLAGFITGEIIDINGGLHFD